MTTCFFGTRSGDRDSRGNWTILRRLEAIAYQVEHGRSPGTFSVAQMNTWARSDGTWKQVVVSLRTVRGGGGSMNVDGCEPTRVPIAELLAYNQRETLAAKVYVRARGSFSEPAGAHSGISDRGACYRRDVVDAQRVQVLVRARNRGANVVSGRIIGAIRYPRMIRL